MFRELDGNDFPEEVVESIINPQYDRYSIFVREILAPEAVAFFLSSGYRAHALWNNNFNAHVNSVLDMINEVKPPQDVYNQIKEEAKRIMRARYGIVVKCEDPIEFESLY